MQSDLWEVLRAVSALDWFETLGAARSEAERLERSIENARACAGPHSPAFAAMGGRGHADPLAGIDRLIDSKSVEKLEMVRAAIARRETRAKHVLYGRSGRGGLARATSREDADILFLRYIKGMSWAAIAREYEPETVNLSQWCKRRAQRACRQVDRIGADVLADS